MLFFMWFPIVTIVVRILQSAENYIFGQIFAFQLIFVIGKTEMEATE